VIGTAQDARLLVSDDRIWGWAAQPHRGRLVALLDDMQPR
jgi:hypothetical protein